MIYLIESNNSYKIGYTTDLQKRLKAYKTHNPTFELITYKDGTQIDETNLLNLLKEYKIENEWFKKDEEVLKTFNNYFPSNLKKSEPMQVYLKDMSGLMKISSKNEILVLMWFWKHSTYISDNQIGNIVVINPVLFKQIEDSTGINQQSVRNMISALKKKNLLLTNADERGVYYLNPQYFFKGKLADRAKCFKQTIEYNIED